MRWPELRPIARLAALCLGLASPTAATAEDAGPVRLSRDAARDLAESLLAEGQPAAAREIAFGLFQADPQDVDALILLAQAAQALGDRTEARQALRAAWAKAETDGERFLTAVMRARLAAQDDRYTAAQFWLRRAAGVSPNQIATDLVAQDYARVRAENPLSLQVAATLTPSNNVNNGSSNATTTFEGLPFVFELSPEAQALSGASAEVSVALRYRIARSDRSEMHLTFDALDRHVFLTKDAQAAAPDAEAGNYAYRVLGAGLSYRWIGSEGGQPYTLTLRGDKSWYGGAAFAHGVSVALAHEIVPNERTRIGLSASVTGTRYFKNDEWAVPVTLGASWARALPNDDTVSGGVTMAQSLSDQETRRYRSATFNLGYDWGEILSGIDLSTRMTSEWRSFDSAFTGADLRNDHRLAAAVLVGFPNVDLFGFEPVVTIEAARTRSNVDLFDTRTVNTGLTFRSSF